MSQLTISQKFFDDLLSFPGRRGLVFGRLLPDLLVRPQVDRRRDAGLQLLLDGPIQKLVLQVPNEVFRLEVPIADPGVLGVERLEPAASSFPPFAQRRVGGELEVAGVLRRLADDD